MKKLKDILITTKPLQLSDADLEATLAEAAEEEMEAGSASLAMAHLSDIITMADELYNTISDLEEVDQGVVDEIEKIYVQFDELYAKVDGMYDISVPDLGPDEDEIEEALGVSLDSILEEETLSEVLKASDPIEDWIHDFIKSDAPQFKDSDKKKRIQQAIAAYYAAQPQKNEEANYGDLAVYVYDFINADKDGTPLKKLITIALGQYFSTDKNQ